MILREGIFTLAFFGSLVFLVDAFFLARCNLPLQGGVDAMKKASIYESLAKKRFSGTGRGLLFFRDDDGLPVPLDINTATEEELSLLPGIGPTRALRIIEARYEHGFFLTTEELVTPYGPLSPGLFGAISSYVTVLSKKQPM